MGMKYETVLWYLVVMNQMICGEDPSVENNELTSSLWVQEDDIVNIIYEKVLLTFNASAIICWTVRASTSHSSVSAIWEMPSSFRNLEEKRGGLFEGYIYPIILLCIKVALIRILIKPTNLTSLIRLLGYSFFIFYDRMNWKCEI